MKQRILFLLPVVVLLGGCQCSSPPPREITVLPDMSASIDPQARQQMFAAINDVAFHLRRGDTLTIIPITGDADAELQGRTLHYDVPPAGSRQVYDSDLRRLNAKISDDLAHLGASALAHPEQRTDILGSIRVAMRGFSPNQTDKHLVVLSDFIQEDQQFDFRRDPRFKQQCDESKIPIDGNSDIEATPSVKIFLGRLKSDEFTKLDLQRRSAIEDFWKRTTKTDGIDPDGPADLPHKLHQ